jgi:hypothetical protein
MAHARAIFVDVLRTMSPLILTSSRLFQPKCTTFRLCLNGCRVPVTPTGAEQRQEMGAQVRACAVFVVRRGVSCVLTCCRIGRPWKAQAKQPGANASLSVHRHARDQAEGGGEKKQRDETRTQRMACADEAGRRRPWPQGQPWPMTWARMPNFRCISVKSDTVDGRRLEVCWIVGVCLHAPFYCASSSAFCSCARVCPLVATQS